MPSSPGLWAEPAGHLRGAGVAGALASSTHPLVTCVCIRHLWLQVMHLGAGLRVQALAPPSRQLLINLQTYVTYYNTAAPPLTTCSTGSREWYLRARRLHNPLPAVHKNWIGSNFIACRIRRRAIQHHQLDCSCPLAHSYVRNMSVLMARLHVVQFQLFAVLYAISARGHVYSTRQLTCCTTHV
jgi:hypothetical protein